MLLLIAVIAVVAVLALFGAQQTGILDTRLSPENKYSSDAAILPEAGETSELVIASSCSVSVGNAGSCTCSSNLGQCRKSSGWGGSTVTCKNRADDGSCFIQWCEGNDKSCKCHSREVDCNEPFDATPAANAN